MQFETIEVLGSGVLHSMHCEPTSPVPHVWLGDSAIPLNELLGRTLAIRFEGRITCSIAEHHAQELWRGLLLSVLQDAGALRPVRGQPRPLPLCGGDVSRTAVGRELLYAAAPRVPRELSRAKVGITTPTNVPMRWLDQGATQAVVVMRTQSRFQAGCVEAALARHVSDRTEWRNLVGRDAQQIDLVMLCERLRGAAAHALAELEPRFPGALRGWNDRRRCSSNIRRELRRSADRPLARARASPSAERCSASRAST